MDITKISTLGELKKSGYSPKTIKEEIRENLREKISKGQEIFKEIIGYSDTVIPDVQRSILSRHNILLLGLRGQAKTRIARLMVNLLDEYVPVIQGNELNDDPLAPISFQGQETVKEMGDSTPVAWLHRDDRYVEKLATPDVSVADLIGDVDPIKAATLKLPYNDPRVIHYGLIPRAHRCIFVMNELPDLQARIQVSLFNILQEGDIQIRGFKMALPLDIQFVFTANPEDYTNRGSIITPLKDRIESQILTHYPVDLEDAMKITEQEAKLSDFQREHIYIPPFLKQILELTSFEARESEYVDEKSGVSARLSVSAMENLYSMIELRMLNNSEKKGFGRITDLWGIIPAITGKVELVYEGEQEGAHHVALSFISGALKTLFLTHFPDPNRMSKKDERDPYGVIKSYFAGGNQADLLNDFSQSEYEEALKEIAGLEAVASQSALYQSDPFLAMELVLFGLAEAEVVGKEFLVGGTSFSDPLADVWGELNDDFE